MVSLKNKNKGFTIVELLIVIIIIGILATLVIVTFTGINQKARNSKRQTDVNAITSHVQAFYAQYGFYPTQADLASTTFVSSYMKGLDSKALQDPKQTSGSIGTAVAADHYGYVASSTTGGSCSNTTATDTSTGAPADNACDAFQVQAQMEGQTAPNNLFTKSSN